VDLLGGKVKKLSFSTVHSRVIPPHSVDSVAKGPDSRSFAALRIVGRAALRMTAFVKTTTDSTAT